MKDLSPDDRPREKLLRHGAAALGDNELVALVLGSGIRGAGALRLANELLRARGGLHGLARSTAGDLARDRRHRRGEGGAAAGGGRTRTPDAGARARRALQLRTPRDAAAYLLPAFGARPVEQFGVVLLDTKHRVLRTTVVASGTLNTTIVSRATCFARRMLGGAAAVVVFHNHPSGDPTPEPRRRGVDAAAGGRRRR